MKDKMFTKDIGKQFEFDETVASVFDDMIIRSVPYYKENIALIVDFCQYNLKKPSLVYDLGSSTGNLLLGLYQVLPKQSHLVGIDNSSAMIQKAKIKAKAYSADIEFICADILEYDFSMAGAMIASFILQFIRPIQREGLLKRLHKSLENGGILFLSEKMISHHKMLDKQMIEHYLKYKRSQGYTLSEISKKREALENVLVPFSLEENMQMLKNVGFRAVEILFKWVNFGTIMAIK